VQPLPDVYEEYRKAKDVTKRRLYLEHMRSVLQKMGLNRGPRSEGGTAIAQPHQSSWKIKMKLKGVWIILLIAAAILVYDSAFTVSETEQVVITQFGRIVGEPIREPGLKFKLPFLQKAHFFNKNILEWDGEPGQIPTLDKTFIWVDAFARWRITDPVKFFQTVNNRFNAISRLNDIIDPAVRNFITSHKLIDAVRKSNRELDTAEVGLEDVEKKPPSHYLITIGREKITQGSSNKPSPSWSSSVSSWWMSRSRASITWKRCASPYMTG
jgi:hypothetical protein